MYVKTIEVPHTVISVTTDENYKYYWVRNLGEHAVGVFKNTPSGPLEGFHVFVNPRECVKVIPEETTLYFASINEDTTNKIEIYGTNTSDCPFKAGKRGGDGGSYSETVLWENEGTTNPETVTLSEPITNFDEFVIEANYTGDAGNYRFSNTWLVSADLVGMRIQLNDETHYCAYTLTTSTTFADHTGSNIVFSKIIGIKYGSYSRVQIGEDPVARAEIAEVEAYIGYNDDTIIGLQADFENRTFTRLAGAKNKNAGADFNVFNMYGNRKLCVVADDGTVNARYGDDGYIEDGSNGQVMVFQPRFYYKTVPIKIEPIAGTQGYHLRKVNYYISDTPHEGFKCHPAFLDDNGKELDGYYIGAYEACWYDTSESEYRKYDSWDVIVDGDTYTVNAYNTYLADANSDLLSSIAGVKPATGTQSTQFRGGNIVKMATNRGTGWTAMNFKMVSAEQLLFAIEYATFNSQSAIGTGVTGYAGSGWNRCAFTGSTASLGNGSGRAESTARLMETGAYNTYTANDLTSVRYRGVENLWGNQSCTMFGVRSAQRVISYCSDSAYATYVSTGITLPTSNDAYISAFGWSYNCDWAFIPTEGKGNSTLPIGDVVSSNNNTILPSLGSNFEGGAKAGIYAFNGSFFHVASNDYSGRLGARLARFGKQR